MENTFEYQNALAKRPIPKLETTCDRFLEWVEPLLTESEFQETKEITKKFTSQGGSGERLQEALVKWSDDQKLSNWTEPLWYDIYLDARTPLPIYSNVFYMLEERERIAKCSQSAAATAFVLSILNFKKKIDDESLAPEMQSGKPLCMNQYTNLFSTTRIPQYAKDVFVKYNDAKHIVVLSRKNIFCLDVVDSEGKIKSYSELENAISTILEYKAGNAEKELGILTTLEREKWAQAREQLLENTENISGIESIDSAIFVLCLDDIAPKALEDCSAHFLHANGENRWFDKALQFIVTKNNRLGFNLEHTGFDGSVVTTMTKYIFSHIDDFIGTENHQNTVSLKPIVFSINSEIKEVIQERLQTLKPFVSDSVIRVMKFNDFGKNKIKTFGVSPDAFVQLSFQLAQYKMFGKCYSSYEAVMARKYTHGRIEVSHCVSSESMKFIKNMVSDTCKDEIKAQSLRVAAQKQTERLGDCRDGRGIDSHLFALQKMYKMQEKDSGLDTALDFFQGIGYKALTHSTVCTSTTAAYGVELVGYGPVVEDGFAVRYLKNADSFTFNMVSRAWKKDALKQLETNIRESLLEMSELMLKVTSQ